MDILYVMAAEQEYGPHLRSRIQPLMCGIGPVEAAIAVTRELFRREASGTRPKLLVSLGSAGSSTLQQGEIYQAASVSYRDMDASPLGFPKGETPLLGLPAEMQLDPRLDWLPQARLSTGANVVSGAAYRGIDADLVDMETFAILRACNAFDVPLIALRGVSDGKKELQKFSDWTEYLHIIDAKLASAVDRVEADFAAGGYSSGLPAGRGASAAKWSSGGCRAEWSSSPAPAEKADPAPAGAARAAASICPERAGN